MIDTKNLPGDSDVDPYSILVSELIEDGNLFESKGYSHVKVTKNGEKKPLRLPIKSTGVAEYQQELSGKAPRPPVMRQLVRKDSPQGKELGLSHDQVMIVFDTTDEKYIDDLTAHQVDFAWKIAIFALDISWKKKDGSEAKAYEDKKKILQSNGITNAQINRIYKDVNDLTQFEADRQDFLSGNSSV